MNIYTERTSTLTVIQFDAPAVNMNMNDRMHWRPKNRLTQAWRNAARDAAINLDPSPAKRAHPPCLVEISLPVRARRPRDPSNLFPTLKACVDGLVDAGLFADDNSDWVHTTEPAVHVDREFRTVTIHLTPLTEGPNQ